MDEHDDEHDDHADEHGHDHGAFDPHGWHNPANAVIYVDNITAALARTDPANASAYYGNRATYVAEIEALDAEIRKTVAGLSEDRRTIVTAHDAFGYFAEAYGLRFVAPLGIEHRKRRVRRGCRRPDPADTRRGDQGRLRRVVHGPAPA